MKKEITIGEAYANAADSVDKEIALKSTPYPAEEQEQKKKTVIQRIAAIFRSLHVKMLLSELSNQKRLIDEMPSSVDAVKAEAQEAYGMRLKEIDRLAAFHIAQSRPEAHKVTEKLRRRGVKV